MREEERITDCESMMSSPIICVRCFQTILQPFLRARHPTYDTNLVTGSKDRTYAIGDKALLVS
jgi:hypothetical protein